MGNSARVVEWNSQFVQNKIRKEKEMFYLMKHSTHFIYGYMMSDIC